MDNYNSFRRKIQLIAGTTYSISLPKEWVLKNKLKEKDDLILTEKKDNTLVLGPEALREKNLEEISLNIDDYLDNIDQVLFAVYYLGIENINLYSEKELTKDVKTRIRRVLRHMSGVVVGYEDEHKMAIKILLEKSKVEIPQLVYRIYLILDQSIKSILEDFDIEEIKMNEDEVDRLFHLMSKIVSLGLVNSNVLRSSGISNVTYIPSYFLIGKRLENIADNIMYMSDYISGKKVNFENKKQLMGFIKEELLRCAKYINSKSDKMFEKLSNDELKKINNIITKVKDKEISRYLEDILRYIVDIEEECVNISFYYRMILENKL